MNGQHRRRARASTPTSTSAARSIGDARVTCYAALDKKLTWNVVPWVPYLWPELLRDARQYQLLIYGVCLMVFVLFMRQGLVSLLASRRRSAR